MRNIRKISSLRFYNLRYKYDKNQSSEFIEVLNQSLERSRISREVNKISRELYKMLTESSRISRELDKILTESDRISKESDRI